MLLPQQVKAVPFPNIPGYNINEATDVLLKRDFDKYRGGPETHLSKSKWYGALNTIPSRKL